MRRSESIRIGREWPWIAAILVTMSLAIWWWPGRRETPRDSLSSSRPGKRAIFEVLKDLHPSTRRDFTPIFEIATGDAGTIVLLGPARRLSPFEWQMLWNWVSEGGHLLFAANADDPLTDLGWFGMKIRTGSAMLATDPYIEFDEDHIYEPEVLEETDDRVLIVRQEVDEGTIVVCASDELFANGTIYRDPDQAGARAYSTFTALRPIDPIVFSEGINAQGRPGVLGVLFSPFVRRLTLQLLLLALVYGWWGYRRAGPPLPKRASPRRSIREHAEAIGVLLRRATRHDRLVDEYCQYVRNELGIRREDELRGARGERIRAAFERAKQPTADRKSALPEAVRALATMLHRPD